MAPGRTALTGGRRRLALRASTGGTLLAFYAAVLVVASFFTSWWRLENQAPQYGKRILYVNVTPRGIYGDMKEIDILGHYVGIRPMGNLAPVERAVAPFAVAIAALCALALPYLGPGKPRIALACVVAMVPFGFIVDLWYWQRYAVTHLDPTAAFSLIADRVQARVFGDYEVAQFKVRAIFGTGFWLVTVAAANVLGFLFAERRRGPRQRDTASIPESATGAAATLALLVLATVPSLARAATLEVGPRSPFPTITGALAVAAPGDEVRVRAGTYREHVVLDRQLTLRGEEGAVIDGGGTGTIVFVRAPGCAVRGLTVRHGGTSLLGEDAGIKVLDAADCIVEHNRVEDTLFGILVKSSPKAVVRHNHVFGADLPLPRRGDGVQLQNSNHCTLEDNTVERSRDLAIWNSNGCQTRRNVVRHCRYGLHYMYCDDNLFEDNVFEGNQTGGAIMYSRRLHLRRNRFTGSRGPSAYGLLIKVGDDVVAEHNWFLDNTSGIFLEETPSSFYASCTIRDNVIGGNDVGVTLMPTVSRTLFTGNAFVANRLQVQVHGRKLQDSNRWSRDGRGNYWSDYVGFDADADGIGDTPYRVEQFFEDLTDRWPAVGVLRLGPASLALEAAARAFPIVSAQEMVVDPHPLRQPPTTLTATRSNGSEPRLALMGALAVAAVGMTLAGSRGVRLGGDA